MLGLQQERHHVRILILANNDVGLFKFRKELIDQLLEEHEVYISLPNGEFIHELTSLGCRYMKTEFNRRGKNPLKDLALLLTYVRMFRLIKPDVVLTYTIKPNVYGGIACRFTGTPYLANITGLGTSLENGGVLRLLTTWLYRLGLKKASCVFFQNQPNFDQFKKEGILNGTARTIPGSGVNLDFHKVENYPDEGEGVNFLFIGRIMKDKGIDELLKAMEMVKKRESTAKLDIVGGCDEDYEEQLYAAQQKGLLQYHGQQSDVRPFLKACHCTVLPSYHEGKANVLLESSATGRPIIATNVTGCREVFEEGVTGLGCEVKNPSSLADAMLRFIALPNHIKLQMGLQGRKKMECEYDRNFVIHAYMEELSKINERG